MLSKHLRYTIISFLATINIFHVLYHYYYFTLMKVVGECKSTPVGERGGALLATDRVGGINWKECTCVMTNYAKRGTSMAHAHKHGFNHMHLQAHTYMDSPTCMHAHAHKHGFNHMRLQAHTYMDSSTCACMHAHTDTHPQKEFLLIAYHKVHRLWWLSLSPRDWLRHRLWWLSLSPRDWLRHSLWWLSLSPRDWLRRDHNVGAHRRG